MAKFHIERAYIESDDPHQDNFSILVHIKDGVEHTFVGKVDIDSPVAWIHMQTAENGDLLINNSAGMEGNKWNHITKEIIGEYNG